MARRGGVWPGRSAVALAIALGLTAGTGNLGPLVALAVPGDPARHLTPKQAHRRMTAGAVRPPDRRPADTGEFIARITGPAEAAHRRTGVPAAVVVGAAVLESAGGTSASALVDRNFFGIKCPIPDDSPAIGCHTWQTVECEPGCGEQAAAFRVYASMADSVNDYTLLLTRPRYRPALSHAGDLAAYVEAIRAAGYATDPAYTAKMLAVINRYHLA